MQTATLNVTGMTCGGCASKVTSALKAVAGVSDVDVSLSEGLVRVQFNESQTGAPQLQAAVEQAGYDAKSAHGCGGQGGKGCCCG